MRKLLPIAITLVLTSCATTFEPSPETYDAIQAEVSKGEWEITQSLPELKYVRGQYFPTLETLKLRSSDGQHFEVMILNGRSPSNPGESFCLAYLKNPQGKIVDWKSCWLDCGSGNCNICIGTKLLDVKNDGIKEFCFINERFELPEQILSAYCVRNGKFEPVIANPVWYFDAGFADTTLPNGLIIKPQLEGTYGWEAGKLYEIPIRVTNSSSSPIDLQGSYVWLPATDFVGGSSSNFDDKLAPGAAVDTTVTVRFRERVPDQKLGFIIKK